jgi:hypothetical protein
MQKMKKHPTVVAAEAAAQVKLGELNAAREAVKRLDEEHSAAVAAVRAAQLAVDASLPRCRVVRVGWRSGKETDDGQVVITRMTPGGMLVVRRPGDEIGNEFKFEFWPHSAKFAEVKKRSSLPSDRLELRDVPATYMPA